MATHDDKSCASYSIVSLKHDLNHDDANVLTPEMGNPSNDSIHSPFSQKCIK